MKCSRDKEIPKPRSKKCSRCKESAEVFLPYSNTNLCNRHFMDLFEKRFKKTNREFKFIKKGDRVAVGLSGGKDSTLLLCMLSRFRKIIPFELFAVTIDSGIHCDYWKRTMKIAEKYTKKFKVEHHIFEFKKEFGFTLDEFVEGLKIQNPCSYCGVFRRYLLNKKSRELGATKLAIGHNLDDAAQTVLLNLARNEPLRLIRFNEHLVESKGFVPRIKPLIRAPEEEIIEYGKLKGLGLEEKHCCPYSKHAMRNSVRSALDELDLQYPGTKLKIFNSFISIQELMKKGLEQEELILAFCKRCKEPSSDKICMCCKMRSEFKK